jgi:hypothetical protein
MTAAALLDRIVPIVRARLPAGVDTEYLDDFLDRNRPALVAVIEANLAPLLRRIEAANQVPAEDLPELWSAAQRTAANVAAMTVAAALAAQGRAATADERRVLAGYSGWGGLSIRSAAGRFPPGFPVPEERGLIHEFYTPTRVAREIARVVGPLLPPGEVHALEPSAGIGRMVRAFEGLPRVSWHAVEWSDLSSRMLAALRPDLNLFVGPFERWVRERGPAWQGRLQCTGSA